MVGQRKMKILWAVDLFEETNGLRTRVIQTLQKISEKQKLEVEPVYVLSPQGLDLALEFSPSWIAQYKPAAEKSLLQMLSGIQLPGLKAPRVLVQSRPSLKFMVKTLVQYAKNSQADLIVIGTHSKKGISRLFLGSFAESTLLASQVPVLVVGPHSEPTQLKSILFPTEFGNKKDPMFQVVLGLAKKFNAKVTLFHVLSHPIEPLLQSGAYLLGGGWVDLPKYMTQVEEVNRRQADQWHAQARKMGVTAEVVFSPSGGNVSRRILDYAKEHPVDLIAMAAHSGPMASALIGSISRQVVREAHCPVWILRSESG
ncbi:MAG: universal stress protein [Bdellovibrionia bacterium]